MLVTVNHTNKFVKGSSGQNDKHLYRSTEIHEQTKIYEAAYSWVVNLGL